MKKIIAILALATAFVLMPHYQIRAAQANQTVIVTITEAQLNQRLAELLAPSAAVNSTANLVIEQGQLAVKGTLTFDFGDEPPTSISFAFKFLPFVKNSKIVCVVTEVQVGDQLATADELHYINRQGANDICDQLFSPFLSAYPNGQVTRIQVTDHAVSVSLILIGQPVAAGCTATTLGNVNLRSGPSASASVITALPAGVTLNAVATQGDWLAVRYHDGWGWLYGTLVSRTCK